MASEYYHATRTPLALRTGSLCVTPDIDAARAYLEGSAGYVYSVAMRGELQLADTDTVRALARKLVPDSPYRRVYELIEEHRVVRAALIEAGYDGATYEDETPDNAATHGTIMVFDATTAVDGVSCCVED